MGSVIRFPRRPHARASQSSSKIRSMSFAATPRSGGPSVSQREIVAWSTPKRPANLVWLSPRRARAALKSSPEIGMPQLCTSHSASQCPPHSVVVQIAQMIEEPHRRLQYARELAGYTGVGGATEAADAMGVKRPTYYAHENGSRGFLDDADRYARFFRVDYKWLTTGRGDPRGNGGTLDSRLTSLSPAGQQRILDYFELIERAEQATVEPAPAPARARARRSR